MEGTDNWSPLRAAILRDLPFPPAYLTSEEVQAGNMQFGVGPAGAGAPSHTLPRTPIHPLRARTRPL